MTRAWIALAAALAAATAAADGTTAVQRRYTYREADDGRAIARVEVVLERVHGQVALVLAVHCRGGEIEPAKGADGVRGENQVTAGELATLVRPDHCRVTSIALDAPSTLAVVGQFTANGRGPLIRRGFDARAGSFTEEPDAIEHVLLVRCQIVHPASPGRFRTTVEVDGRSRLGIAWRIDDRGAPHLEWIGQPTSRPAAWRIER